jgi:lipoprotein-anchoring transpeptidase ErfK/SrfK
VLVSTGKRSTPTIKGKFVIGAKYRYARIRGPGYDIPNVPYTMYFYNGYAIHGAFWHNRFGTPVSHGCVNLPVKQARKLFNWANVGTAVVVQN